MRASSPLLPLRALSLPVRNRLRNAQCNNRIDETKMRYCPLPPDVARDVHIFSFIHNSTNLSAYLKHHVETVGVPIQNFHIFVDGTLSFVPYNLRVVALANVTYSSDLKRDVINE